MRDETVARNYAEALFETAQATEGLEVYGEGIEMVARLLDEDDQFRHFLETPRIAAVDKKKVIRKAFEENMPARLVNFLLLTIDKRRQRLLRTIAQQFHALVDEHENRVHVEVTVARALGEEALGEVSSRISALLGKEAIAHVRVRPEIMGGVVVRVGDIIFDGSLRHRMERMRRQLLLAEIPASPGAEAAGS